MIFSGAPRKKRSRKGDRTALIEDGLRRVLADRAPARQAECVLPPVSSATGGLMPGVDLEDAAALQEIEDLATAARLR
jgi:hypothetical protein